MFLPFCTLLHDSDQCPFWQRASYNQSYLPLDFFLCVSFMQTYANKMVTCRSC